MAVDKVRVPFCVELDPEFAAVWNKVAHELSVPVCELMRKFLEWQAADFLERHPEFIEKV